MLLKRITHHTNKSIPIGNHNIGYKSEEELSMDSTDSNQIVGRVETNEAIIHNELQSAVDKEEADRVLQYYLDIENEVVDYGSDEEG